MNGINLNDLDPRAHALGQEYLTGAIKPIVPGHCQGAAAIYRDGSTQGMYLLSYRLLANWLTIVRGLLRALRNNIDRNNSNSRNIEQAQSN